jgi:hypothetical protein
MTRAIGESWIEGGYLHEMTEHVGCSGHRGG